jgi:GMP synthase (glutamine-hydrolysing)
VPYLGLCLGAQLLTRAAGGKVAPHAEEHVEVGYADIRPTEAGRAWFKAPMKVYQWHREGMHLPDCCELLATNDTFPVQAFRCGPNAFGFQFHPEVTLEMKHLWTLQASESLKRKGAQQRGVHLSMHPLYDPPLGRWIDGFLDRWLATDTRFA